MSAVVPEDGMAEIRVISAGMAWHTASTTAAEIVIHMSNRRHLYAPMYCMWDDWQMEDVVKRMSGTVHIHRKFLSWVRGTSHCLIFVILVLHQNIKSCKKWQNTIQTSNLRFLSIVSTEMHSNTLSDNALILPLTDRKRSRAPLVAHRLGGGGDRFYGIALDLSRGKVGNTPYFKKVVGLFGRKKWSKVVGLPKYVQTGTRRFLLNRGYKQETRRRKLKTSKTDFHQAENTRLYMIEETDVNGK